MATTPIRIGLIGCGMITQRSHAPGLAAIPDCRITAVCDLQADRMAKVREEHAPEAETFADYRALLNSGLVDAVTVATPVYLHCPMTLAALDAGCHVLCEKPMGMSQAETGQMVAAAREAERVLQINLSRRYDPFYQMVRRMISEGLVGEPRHLRAIRVHTTAPDQGWSPGARWFVTRSQGGGIVGDIGVHVGDMMQWFFGPVQTVSAVTATRRPDIDVVDNATALLRFASGATGVLELSWTSPVNQMTFEVHGSEGVLQAGGQSESLWLKRKGADPLEITPAEFDARDRDSFQCFVQAASGVAPTPVPGETGHAIQRVLDAIVASGEQGGVPVTV